MNEISTFKKTFRKIRSYGTFYIAKESLQHLEAIREYELTLVLNMLPAEGRILELGAGTGCQAKILESKGYNVSAIDLPSSNYIENRIWPIIDYDGKNIPFDDNTFDIVFSSNVLEHVPHTNEFQKEIQRVLKEDGCALHVMPSSSWRFWTSITHFIRYWTIPTIHGEHAGSVFMEMFYFSRRWWAKKFINTDWTIVSQGSNRLFCTGCAIMGLRFGINLRRKLSRLLGSSCNIFFLRKRNSS